jgi:hypothetical protein
MRNHDSLIILYYITPIYINTQTSTYTKQQATNVMSRRICIHVLSLASISPGAKLMFY